jgi:hypothetical protein
MRKEERKLSVKLTETEKTECAKQSARLLRRLRALKEKKKANMKELGDQIKETERAADMKAAAFDTGIEERMVSCTGTVIGMQLVVTRDDTHEVIEERTLSEEELEGIDASPEASAEPPKRTRVGKKKAADAADAKTDEPPSSSVH